VLVGDADMLHEQFYVRVMNPGNAGDGPAVQPEPSISPEPGRVAERGQGPDQHAQPRDDEPALTKVRELQAKAEERFANKIKELEKSESDMNQKINELVRGKQPGQHVILSRKPKRNGTMCKKNAPKYAGR